MSTSVNGTGTINLTDGFSVRSLSSDDRMARDRLIMYAVIINGANTVFMLGITRPTNEYWAFSIT
jgi:hypothetical protein